MDQHFIYNYTLSAYDIELYHINIICIYTRSYPAIASKGSGSFSKNNIRNKSSCFLLIFVIIQCSLPI